MAVSLSRLLQGLAPLLAAGLALAGCVAAAPSQGRPPAEQLLTPAVVPTRDAAQGIPPAPPSAAAGAALYAEKCAPCHGETGQADGPQAGQVRAQGGLVPKLADPALQRAARPSDWHDLITQGRIERLMPGFSGSLDAQQRWDVIAYVWALGTTPQALQAGQALYAQQCAACHGAAGAGDGPQAAGARMASFADPAWLSRTSLLAMADAMQQGQAHQAVRLDEPQRFQVADYARSLGYAHADPAELRQASETGDGALALHAQNLTPGGAAARGLPVVLRAYDAASEVLSRTAELDGGGMVTFAGLPRDPAYFYQAEMVYSGAKFYAAPAQFTATQVITGSLPFYEVTTDPAAITIGEWHFFVQGAGEGTATIVEFYLFDNGSDRAYVAAAAPGAPMRSVRVSLPEDAVNLRFDGPGLGARFFQSGTLLYDMDTVAPGARASSITLAYEVPYRGARTFERQAFYPVAAWDVLLPDGDLRAPDLQDAGAQETQAGTIRRFTPSQPAIPADGLARFQLSGQPRGVAVPGGDARAIGVGLVALAAAVGLAAVLVARARRGRGAEGSGADERQALLLAIVALDQQHAAGAIEEPGYRKKRDALKRRLRDAWDRE